MSQRQVVRNRSETPPCFHGGAFFEAVGPRFDDLGRRAGVINADVLDAWFDPAPGVLEALREHLPWLVRTSPPTLAEGLIAAIAEARGVPEASLVTGSGSSDLIFRIFPRWLSKKSRVLILDPTYSEYSHVLDHVVGCRVDRLRLRRGEGFDLPIDRLRKRLERGYDLVVLVNPNNPTGRFTPAETIAGLLDDAPPRTKFWIDEAYVDYTGPDGSLERSACSRNNLFVCKTMSKVYALSGLRVAYLLGEPEAIREIRGVTPPWVVGLPAQVAAVHALLDPVYYAERHAETHRLREGLVRSIGLATVPSRTNGFLAWLPSEGPTAAGVVAACRTRGLFLRDPGVTSPSLGTHVLRFAVKDEATNARMSAIFHEVTDGLGKA